jgi:hypothetical protein
MKEALVGFAWFIGYLVVAKVVVKPLATQFNIPYIKDI